MYTAVLFAILAISILALISKFIADSIFKENVLAAIDKCMSIIPIWVLFVSGIIAVLFLMFISATTLMHPVGLFFLLLLVIAGLILIWGFCVFIFILSFVVLRLGIKHPYIVLIIGVISAVIGVLNITGILPISQLI